MHLQFGLASLTLYAFAVLYPGFTILLALAGRLHIPLGWRRGAFVAASSLLLSPGPFLLTPFGPGALVPLPLSLPLAFLAPPLRIVLAASAAGTAAAALLSLSMRAPATKPPPGPEA